MPDPTADRRVICIFSSRSRRMIPFVIYSDANISYIDAIHGASFKMPVVDGEVRIKVPPGAQPGQVIIEGEWCRDWAMPRFAGIIIQCYNNGFLDELELPHHL